jgi:acyl-CoA dehydrogenase
MLIPARTAPLDEVKSHTDALSLFYTALDRRFVAAARIRGRVRCVTATSST